MLVTGLWWLRLETIPPYFQRTLELGYYATDSDTIAIPIAGNAVLTFVGFPFVVGLLWLALRRYPLDCSLLSWSPRRRFAAIAWTGIFLGLVAYELNMCVREAEIGLPFNAVVDVLWVVAWLWLRAVIVEKVRRQEVAVAPFTRN